MMTRAKSVGMSLMKFPEGGGKPVVRGRWYLTLLSQDDNKDSLDHNIVN